MKRYKEGLILKIAYDEQGQAMGYIECIPAEYAWRPIQAPGFLFIHCMYVYPNSNKHKGVGSALIKSCEKDADVKGKFGLATFTSNGTWVFNKNLFLKNGFSEIQKLGRFELMVKKNREAPDPVMINWESKQADYKGWHLLHASQCPWHEKSVEAISELAATRGINLKVQKIQSSEEARNGPSGFGVFALLNDGKLLEDHYISSKRFENILNKELADQQK